MDNIQQFRSVIPAERSERIFRDLIKKQEAGEIRTEAQLREELEKQINAVNARGQVTFEIPVRPGEVISSEAMARFFESVSTDIDVLFVEVDHTDELLTRQAEVIAAQIQSLRFAMGQLKAEGIQKKIRIKPGAGFTTIARDSFDRGYSDLAGRAEVPYDLFKDVRSAEDTAKAEAIPIQADARVEGIGKKLILPAATNKNIGFKDIKIVTASSTVGDLPVSNIYPIFNAIDGFEDTFWSLTLGTEWPLLGTSVPAITRVQGTSGLNPTVNFSGLKDPRPHDYYVKVVGWSGIYPIITSLPTAEAYVGPVCQYDTGLRCFWNYDKQYSQNCINSNCSRYGVDNTSVVSGSPVALEDGFRLDTGATVTWTNFSGLGVGTTFKVSNQPSGTVGATIALELTLTTPDNINWIELDPVIDAPFVITNVEYTQPNESTRYSIVTGSVHVEDRIRIDMPRIEAEKVYLTLQQSNYRKSRLVTNPKNTALNQIEAIKSGPTDPTPVDLATVDMPILMEDFARDPDVRDVFVQTDWTPEINDGYFYQVGLFEVNCGLSSYSENAIAVSKERRVRTPTMFGVQANLEPGIDIAVSGTDVGTFEFSVVKLNYDEQGSLINIQDFPVPIAVSGAITERLFIDDTRAGQLRFAASSITSVTDLANSRTLAATEYSLSTSDDTAPVSTVTIDRSDISSANVLIVVYVPKFGVYLDSDKSLAMENNNNFQLSINDVQAVVTAEPKVANRKIDYSDVYTRIIIRRNDNDSHNTPKLRDYQLLISEQDPNRFFV
jgi:hypothetical protein